jgi:hypothetical protein
MLETGGFIVGTLAREVPHRHIVFTIPKLMRKNFYWHREALNDLSRMAWKCLLAFMRKTIKRDGRPGAVLGIETSGEYLDCNPHIHMLTTDGLFTDSGTFHFMPRYHPRAQEYLKTLWEHEVTKYVVKKGYVTETVAAKVLNFRHTGFSVFTERRVDYKKSNEDSVKELEALARYIAKPHFSLDAMEYVPQTGKMLYHGSMHKGKKRNFEIFDACDFIAAVTSHIPKKRQKYINAYGVYSNKSRGMERADDGDEISIVPASDDARANAKTWAMLIRKVWEVDPLICPTCGGAMKVISIIDARQGDVIKRILTSLGEWTEEEARAPPKSKDEQPDLELTYEPIIGEWRSDVDVFESVQAETTEEYVDDAVAHTDEERWYLPADGSQTGEPIVDEWAGSRSEFADA